MIYDLTIKKTFSPRLFQLLLAFLMPNCRNVTFFKVVLHGKMLFGMYVIVCPVYGRF